MNKITEKEKLIQEDKVAGVCLFSLSVAVGVFCKPDSVTRKFDKIIGSIMDVAYSIDFDAGINYDKESLQSITEKLIAKRKGDKLNEEERLMQGNKVAKLCLFKLMPAIMLNYNDGDAITRVNKLVINIMYKANKADFDAGISYKESLQSVGKKLGVDEGDIK